MSLKDLNIDSQWSLFLDRDGVINKRLPGAYVRTTDEFVLLEGVAEAMKIFAGIFGRILVVTNQQGIGKGLMSVSELDVVHKHMQALIEKGGGRIESIYFCDALASSGSFYRKPAVGMGLKARKEHRGLNFKRSLMAGDSLSDMIFGKRLGMHTVLIGDNPEAIRNNARYIDSSYSSLYELSIDLNTILH